MTRHELFEVITDRLAGLDELPLYNHPAYLIDAARRSGDHRLKAVAASFGEEPAVDEAWEALVGHRAHCKIGGTLTKADLHRALMHHRESIDLVASWWDGRGERMLFTLATGPRGDGLYGDCVMFFSNKLADLKVGTLLHPIGLLSITNAEHQLFVGLASWFRGRRFRADESRAGFEHASATVLYRLPAPGTWRGGCSPWPPVDWEKVREWSRPHEQISLFGGAP